MSNGIRTRSLQADEIAPSISALSDVLIDCVEGGASIGFMLPMTQEKAIAFWQNVARGVMQGERALLVAEDETNTIMGTVQLVLAQPENQPHRADVAKLLVHRKARRRGVAQELMRALEHVAKDAGKSVLVLDTVSGGDASRLYERAEWQRVGDIPNYALMPTGERCATTYYCKEI